ncbi:hypothetical protein GF323_02525 [Candidatus Woesearchaeota archaeon]|nr:hypothetical protein [Candidatus Woesearchaeota archaeon]
MACTAISISSIILNVVFLAAITWLLIQYFGQKRQIRNLVKEFENESLEHYLKQIRNKGFDVTVKPKKGK